MTDPLHSLFLVFFAVMMACSAGWAAAGNPKDIISAIHECREWVLEKDDEKVSKKMGFSTQIDEARAIKFNYKVRRFVPKEGDDTEQTTEQDNRDVWMCNLATIGDWDISEVDELLDAMPDFKRVDIIRFKSGALFRLFYDCTDPDDPVLLRSQSVEHFNRWFGEIEHPVSDPRVCMAVLELERHGDLGVTHD